MELYDGVEKAGLLARAVLTVFVISWVIYGCYVLHTYCLEHMIADVTEESETIDDASDTTVHVAKEVSSITVTDNKLNSDNNTTVSINIGGGYSLLPWIIVAVLSAILIKCRLRERSRYNHKE